MLALALLALVPIMMWLGQSVLLQTAGLPIRWRLTSADLSPARRQANRIIANASLASVVLAYPLLRGQSPLAYYAALLPLGPAAGHLAFGVAASALYLSLLYTAWLATDNLRIEIRNRPSRLLRRLAIVPLTAAMAGLIEELLFRGMLMQSLLESFGPVPATALSILIFTGAHYVRSVKRYWTFAGHLALGALLCIAFLCTRNLWLPIGLHAGGVLLIMGLRPFVRYSGPPWLVGASIFPYAGAVGVAALVLLMINIWLRFGVHA